MLHDIFIATHLKFVENLRLRDKQLLYDYLGIVDFNRGWVIPKNKIRYGDIADKYQLRDEQSVTNRFRKIAAGLMVELKKEGWIDGEHASKPADTTEKDKPELTALDCEIISYAVHKWRESGLPAEMHMLFREVKVIDERMVLEFMRLWLY